jgi:hypothetical protein
MKTKSIAAVSALLLLGLLTSCATLPNDGANVQSKHYDNLHTLRYVELFIVGGNGITGNLKANVYNTTFRGGYTGKDSAPQAWAESINLEDLKKQWRALATSMNGPKLWMLDWIDISLGTERTFNGLTMPWCAELSLTKTQAKEMGKLAYVTTTIARKSAFGYNKGTTVYLIDDTDGNTWIMKGFELGLNPTHTFEQFSADPGSYFKKLPTGWKFRTKVLDEDLKLVPETGIATIMPDEMFNVYDKTGPGYSNYKP